MTHQTDRSHAHGPHPPQQGGHIPHDLLQPTARCCCSRRRLPGPNIALAGCVPHQPHLRMPSILVICAACLTESALARMPDKEGREVPELSAPHQRPQAGRPGSGATASARAWHSSGPARHAHSSPPCMGSASMLTKGRKSTSSCNNTASWASVQQKHQAACNQHSNMLPSGNPGHLKADHSGWGSS